MKKTLTGLIEEALASSNTDAELASILLNSGAIQEALSQGTYDDQAVVERMNFSSSSVLRATLSKARNNKGNFPTPLISGRFWSRAEIERYRASQGKN